MGHKKIFCVFSVTLCPGEPKSVSVPTADTKHARKDKLQIDVEYSSKESVVAIQQLIALLD